MLVARIRTTGYYPTFNYQTHAENCRIPSIPKNFKESKEKNLTYENIKCREKLTGNGLTLQTHHVYFTLKKRGNDRFNMGYTWYVCRVMV